MLDNQMTNKANSLNLLDTFAPAFNKLNKLLRTANLTIKVKSEDDEQSIPVRHRDKDGNTHAILFDGQVEMCKHLNTEPETLTHDAGTDTERTEAVLSCVLCKMVYSIDNNEWRF